MSVSQRSNSPLLAPYGNAHLIRQATKVGTPIGGDGKGAESPVRSQVRDVIRLSAKVGDGKGG